MRRGAAPGGCSSARSGQAGERGIRPDAVVRHTQRINQLALVLQQSAVLVITDVFAEPWLPVQAMISPGCACGWLPNTSTSDAGKSRIST